jgi:putative DNA primase/helicase
VLPPDAGDLFFEVLGLAIYPANPMQKAVLLLGPGGNGKSAALELTRALLGSRNVSAVPLQELGENRFAAAELYGKLANVCGDLDARTIQRTDLFKLIVGGDPVSADRKHRDRFTFTCHALLIFSANTPPMTSDQTQAWFDRWITIPFPNRFRGTSREDIHLREKLTSEAELEGLLVRAVRGLQRLMARGRFDVPASVSAKAEEYREALDSVRAFIKAECRIERGAWTKRADLYGRYETFCHGENRHVLKASNVYARLRDDYPGQIAEAKRRGERGFQGVALSEGGQAEAVRGFDDDLPEELR